MTLMPEQSRVRIAIYDITGREVDVLLHSTLEPGHHSATWNLLGNERLPGGCYFCKATLIGLKTHVETRLVQQVTVIE